MTLASVNERSTKVITVPFTDQNGTAVTPTSATWTLSDELGNVANSRSNVAISPLSTSATIVLSGDDLALTSSLLGQSRKITVKAVYNSSVGNGLTFNHEETFRIVRLVNVS